MQRNGSFKVALSSVARVITRSAWSNTVLGGTGLRSLGHVNNKRSPHPHAGTVPGQPRYPTHTLVTRVRLRIDSSNEPFKRLEGTSRTTTRGT